MRNVEAEHEAHQHHLKEENGGKLPEPPAFEYLNRRGELSSETNLVGHLLIDSQSFWSFPLGHEHSVLQRRGALSRSVPPDVFCQLSPVLGQQGHVGH